MTWEICQPVGSMSFTELGRHTRRDDWESISLSRADNSYDTEDEAMSVIHEMQQENEYEWLATRRIGERYADTVFAPAFWYLLA